METDPATREQTVLFGLLAVQSGKLSAGEWEEAAVTLVQRTLAPGTLPGAAPDDFTVNLADQLVAAGTLSPHDAATLQGMAAQALQQHAGDAVKAIQALKLDAELVHTVASGVFADAHEAVTFVQHAAHDPNAATVALDHGRQHDAQTLPTGVAGAGSIPGDSSYAETLATDSATAQTIASQPGGDFSHANTVVAPNRPASAAPTIVGAGATGRVRPGGTGDVLPAVAEHAGRYDYVKLLGQGGMGQIAIVHDNHLGRDVAIKTLLPDRVPGGTRGRTRTGAPTMEILTVPIIARFMQEARIAGQLEHPGIAPAYELGYKADGTIYYTMQQIHGRDLDKLLKECKTLQERMVYLPALLDVCNAIAFAHSRGVIHRDLKPLNVMRGEFGETITIDWGIAKIKGTQDIQASEAAERTRAYRSSGTQASTKTMEGQAMGSPYYMPPEQAAGKIDLVDERADIYALGAILYAILAGNPPYKEMKVLEFLDKVQSQPPRPIRDQAPDAPAELIAVCERAMARKPEDRYQSALELRDELEKYIDGGLVGAYTYTLKELLQRWIRRHKKILSTAFAGVVAFILLAIYSYIAVSIQRDEAIHQRELAVESEAKAVVAREHAETELYFSNTALAQGSIADLQMASARKLLEEAPAKDRNWEWGHLQQAANQDRMTLQIGGQYVAIAANGKIITGNDRGTLSVVNPDTGDSEAQLIKTAGYGYAFAMSADGKRAAMNGPGGVFVWDIETQKQLFMQPHELEQGKRFPFGVSLSADGERVAANEPDNFARVWNVTTAEKAYEAPALYGGIFLDSVGKLAVVVNLDRDQNTFINSVVDLATGQAIKQYDFGADNAVKDAQFSNDGRHVAFATDHALILFETKDWTMPVKNAEGEGAPITGPFGKQDAVDFSSDSKYLIAGTTQGQVFRVDLSNYEGFYAAVPHTSDVRSIAIANEVGLVATTGGDRSIHLYRLDTLDLVRSYPGHDTAVFDVAVNGAGTLMASASPDGSTKVWDLTANLNRHFYPQIANRAVAFAPEAGRLAIATPDGVILADAATERDQRILAGVNGNLLALDSAGNRLAVYEPGDSAGRVAVYDVAAEPKVVNEWKIVGVVGRIALSADGSVLVSDSDEGVQVHNVSTGETAPLEEVTGWALAPRGNVLAVIKANPDGASGRVNFIALPAREDLGGFEVPQAPSLLWGSDGRVLYAGLTRLNAEKKVDGVLLRWDVAKKAALPELVGHGNQPTALADTATLIASGAGDSTIIVWDAATGKALHTLKGHASKITSLAFSPDGSRLASGSLDGSFKLWSSTEDRLIATVQESAKNYVNGLAGRDDLKDEEKTLGDVRWYTGFTPDGATLATISQPALPPVVLHALPWRADAFPGAEPLQERIEAYKRTRN